MRTTWLAAMACGVSILAVGCGKKAGEPDGNVQRQPQRREIADGENVQKVKIELDNKPEVVTVEAQDFAKANMLNQAAVRKNHQDKLIELKGVWILEIRATTNGQYELECRYFTDMLTPQQTVGYGTYFIDCSESYAAKLSTDTYPNLTVKLSTSAQTPPRYIAVEK